MYSVALMAACRQESPAAVLPFEWYSKAASVASVPSCMASVSPGDWVPYKLALKSFMRKVAYTQPISPLRRCATLSWGWPCAKIGKHMAKPDSVPTPISPLRGILPEIVTIPESRAFSSASRSTGSVQTS